MDGSMDIDATPRQGSSASSSCCCNSGGSSSSGSFEGDWHDVAAAWEASREVSATAAPAPLLGRQLGQGASIDACWHVLLWRSSEAAPATLVQLVHVPRG